jgi:hypothetical protein
MIQVHLGIDEVHCEDEVTGDEHDYSKWVQLAVLTAATVLCTHYPPPYNR